MNRLSGYLGDIQPAGPSKRQKQAGAAAMRLLDRTRVIATSNLKELKKDNDEEEAADQVDPHI